MVPTIEDAVGVFVIRVLTREGVGDAQAARIECENHEVCVSLLDDYVAEHSSLIPINREKDSVEEAVAMSRALTDLDAYVTENLVPKTDGLV